MARDDWFRRTTQTETDREDFLARLNRSRGASRKAQFARIQAWTLFEAGGKDAAQAALELLEIVLREWPEDTELAMVHTQRADCLWALGDTDGAVAAWREAMETQRRVPGWGTSASLDFAFTVATARLGELYTEALDALEEFGGNPVLPIEIYKNAAARALIHDDVGEEEEAARFARLALKAVEKGGAGLGGGFGAVHDPDAAIYTWLESLADYD